MKDSVDDLDKILDGLVFNHEGPKKEGWCCLREPSVREAISQHITRQIVEEIRYWANFLDDPSMNAMTPSERLNKRADQLESTIKEEGNK